ncbi:MAG: PD-(D/E)XK nuclease family protein [Methylococcaceae bacterium]
MELVNPPIYPLTLNLAVDELLKKEFDVYREAQKRHPLMEAHKIRAVPAKHPELDVWRQNFKGIHFLHQPTNFIVTAAIDELWQILQPGPPLAIPSEYIPDSLLTNEYHVVDFKATSKKDSIVELNKKFGYQEQMDIYQWVFRQNGFNISKTGYFAYYNGRKELDVFNNTLEFAPTLITCLGNDSWIEPTLLEIHACLNNDKIPPASNDCDYCAYREAVKTHEGG